MQGNETTGATATPGTTTGEVMRGREMLGLPVYSIAEGKRLGDINALFVRREDFMVPVIGIAGSGGQGYLRYDALKTVGTDIVLVATEHDVLIQMTPEARAGLDAELPNRPVFTQSGQSAGHLVGFNVDTATGRIGQVRIAQDRSLLSKVAALGRDTTVLLPISMVHSIGADAVIVQDAVMAMLNPPA